MADRRLRVIVLALGLTLAAGALCVALQSRTTVIRDYDSVTHDSGGDESPSSTEVAEPAPRPFVRAPIPIDQRFVPVPIAVELGHDLQPIGPNQEHELWTYADVNVQSRAPGHVITRVGIANGFGGVNADITFDPETKSALILVANCYDITPMYRPWSEVQGTIRIQSWSLRADTLIDVDVRGTAEGREDSFHVCAPLQAQAFEPMRSDSYGFR